MYPRVRGNPPAREISRETDAIRRSYFRESIPGDTHGERSWRRGRGGRGRSFGRERGREGCRASSDEDGALEHQPRHVGLEFKALQQLDTKTPDEIILELTSSRCFPAAEFLLTQQTSMSDEWIVLTASIVAKACSGSSKECLIKLLTLLPNSLFLTVHLRAFLNRLSASSMPTSEVATFFSYVIKIINELLQRFPNSYTDLPVFDLYCGIKFLSDSQRLTDGSLMREVEELMKLRTQKAEELNKSEEEKQHRRKPWRDAGKNDDVDPPDNFRMYPVIPTQEDILTAGRPFLRRNKTDGSYHDVEHYLDVQFRLLREDFVRPLREGIAKLLECIDSANIGALQDIRVYEDVQLLYPMYTSDGLRYRIKFDNARLRNVRWENSKRLIFGSLVCLSKDKFESFVFATIANRDIEELEQGKVDIQFINFFDNVRLDERDVFHMVESTVYFEAYRHILEGLKEVKTARLPLQKYIINCEKDVDPPAYLRNRYRERVTYDLTPIMRKQSSNSTTSLSVLRRTKLRTRRSRLNLGGRDVPILSLASWPTAEELDLDDSQYKAIQMALTKEFAVIQGPPGTGKTYIGLKIANVLLHNKRKWDTGTELFDDDLDDLDMRVSERRPILVVCYTNHALDQFLEGIYKFHPKGIVRIGGRSKSEVMKDCSLRELKKKMHKEKSAPWYMRKGFYDAQSEMENISEKLQSAAENLQKCFESLLHEEDLQRAGSMTSVQYQSLKAPFDGLDGRKDSAILHWLQLSWNSPSSKQGVSVQPLAAFPLNRQCGGLELVSGAKLANFSCVSWAPGPDGKLDGSMELRGSPDSFAEIPNQAGRDLDTWKSITILMYVLPVGDRGPILCFHKDGLGVQIWQEGVEDGKGILTARFVRRDLSQPPALTKAVLTINTWNFIGASYEQDTGIARLWHNGNEVEAKFIGEKMELATQFSIRVGAITSTAPAHCFYGRICELQIFGETLGKEMVRSVGESFQHEDGVEEQGEDDEESEEEEEDNAEGPDVLYEADVMQEQRVLDSDDVRVFGAKSRALKEERLRVVDPFASTGEVEDGWQFQKAYRLKRRLKRKIIEELRRKDVMPHDIGKMVQNVWTLNLNDRWRLYRRWLMDVSNSYRCTIWRFQRRFEWGARRLKDIKTKEDFEILKNADVIGLTTTGAAKYRKLLKRLQPRITIVEEAAEVLEAHIVTSLTYGCQHLILIGDHQQLRPNPTVYELAKDYNLDVSLFERMVTNGMPFERLNLQHRMRPEISKMLDHIYLNPKLENHQSVLNFENIKGVNGNVFFVDHDESEEYQEEGRSRSNKHEAKFLAALCRYLILQGYKRKQITVLTAYTGQLTQLKKEMPKDFFSGVRVCAVDNFQGEENDIILLSLVRSNEQGKIGFLKIENRVCVALSRAKKGFYCIGNISFLKEKSGLWSKIFGDMKERGNVGTALTLSCQNHPRNVIQASRADDFRRAPQGGCTVPCATRMACGHVCKMPCHPTDPEHKEYQCRKPCSKTLCSSNHKCPRRCYEDCGPCTAPCENILECEHVCAGNCSLCFRGRVHVPCKSSCGRTLFCGHACSEPCTKNCPPCKEPCGNSCTHRKCAQECGEPCEPCNKKCSWQCEHQKCTRLCGQQCDRGRCNEPCKKRLACNHPCIGLCGEKCPEKCRVCHKDEVTEIFFGTEDDPNARFVELDDCGHVFEVEMMDQWMDQESDDGQAVDVKLKRCPKCATPIRTSLRLR